MVLYFVLTYRDFRFNSFLSPAPYYHEVKNTVCAVRNFVTKCFTTSFNFFDTLHLIVTSIDLDLHITTFTMPILVLFVMKPSIFM